MLRHLHSGGDLQGHGRVDVMSDMSRFDGERLHQLVVNHARATGSLRARHILENWDGYLPKFRKVMPVEYRRALAELAAQNEQAMLAAGELLDLTGSQRQSDEETFEVGETVRVDRRGFEDQGFRIARLDPKRRIRFILHSLKPGFESFELKASAKDLKRVAA